MSYRGSLPSIIRNDDNLYEGNLNHYFKVIFFQAQNLEKPYHNFRHMFHALWLCYQACIYYRRELTVVEMRNLLIAIMFHDFDHPGLFGNDDLNIERSVRALEKHIAPEDRASLEDIKYLMRATEYPHTSPSESLSLSGKIIRDADVAQGFSTAWIQQVIFGLSSEWGKTPVDLLILQESFLRNLKFNTEWAQSMFPQSDIDAKIQESKELLALLQ